MWERAAKSHEVRDAVRESVRLRLQRERSLRPASPGSPRSEEAEPDGFYAGEESVLRMFRMRPAKERPPGANPDAAPDPKSSRPSDRLFSQVPRRLAATPPLTSRSPRRISLASPHLA